MSDNTMYGCYKCVTKEGDGCIIVSFGIKSTPVVCPYGNARCNFVRITGTMYNLAAQNTFIVKR